MMQAFRIYYCYFNLIIKSLPPSKQTINYSIVETTPKMKRKEKKISTIWTSQF